MPSGSWFQLAFHGIAAAAPTLEVPPIAELPKPVPVDDGGPVIIVPPEGNPRWTEVPWTLTDVTFKQPLALLVTATVKFETTGIATGTISNTEDGGDQEFDYWLQDGDSAADYEVRVNNVFGGNPIISDHAFNAWYPLSSEVEFKFQYGTRSNIRHHSIIAAVRKIGNLHVNKTINIDIAGDNGEAAP